MKNEQENDVLETPVTWASNGYTLFNGIREKSFVAALYYFLFSLRRIFYVFFALLAYGMGWLQVTVYLV